MTPTYWFLLALVWAATLCLAGWAGWAACYQARDLDVLAAEREGRARGMAQGVAQGQLEGYNGGFTAGWRAAHRLALTELGAYPTSRGGKRIVKALAAGHGPVVMTPPGGAT